MTYTKNKIRELSKEELEKIKKKRENVLEKKFRELEEVVNSTKNFLRSNRFDRVHGQYTAAFNRAQECGVDVSYYESEYTRCMNIVEEKTEKNIGRLTRVFQPKHDREMEREKEKPENAYRIPIISLVNESDMQQAYKEE